MTQVSIFKEKYSRYTPPTNQGWAKKVEDINDESSHSKHKIFEIQVYIIKRKKQGTHHPLICVGRKKKSRVMMKAAIQNTKKRHKFQSSKKNIQGTHHTLIRVARKKKRGVMMKAAIQQHKK